MAKNGKKSGKMSKTTSASDMASQQEAGNPVVEVTQAAPPPPVQQVPQPQVVTPVIPAPPPPPPEPQAAPSASNPEPASGSGEKIPTDGGDTGGGNDDEEPYVYDIDFDEDTLKQHVFLLEEAQPYYVRYCQASTATEVVPFLLPLPLSIGLQLIKYHPNLPANIKPNALKLYTDMKASTPIYPNPDEEKAFVEALNNLSASAWTDEDERNQWLSIRHEMIVNYEGQIPGSFKSEFKECHYHHVVPSADELQVSDFIIQEDQDMITAYFSSIAGMKITKEVRDDIKTTLEEDGLMLVGNYVVPITLWEATQKYYESVKKDKGKGKANEGEEQKDEDIEIIKDDEEIVSSWVSKSDMSTYKTKTYVPPELKALWEVPEMARLDFIQTNIMLKNYPFTAVGVSEFIQDNTLDPTMFKDVAYASIVVKLISLGMINSNSEAPLKQSTEIKGLISTESIKKFESAARMMAVVAVHAHSQGLQDDTIKWYNSFTAVKGNFLSEQKFTMVAKLIIASKNFGKILSVMTVGEIMAENKVLQYRLDRISSPGLIRHAVTNMPYDAILEWFDADALLKYKEFHEAGILAQIAAGPLAPYCKGNIDPRKSINIPSETPLSDLKAIADPPYDESIIKRSYIILEEMDFNFGKWYQGNKAMNTYNTEDARFRTIVKAVLKKIKAMAQESVDSITVDADVGKAKRNENKKLVPKVIRGW